MPKLAPLDDSETYHRYAYEAQERLEKLAKERQVRQNAAKGLMLKAGAMGVTSVADITKKGELEAGDKAYDHMENVRESEQEDQQKRMADNIRKSREAAKRKK